jgi:hypothetical protein
VRARLLERHQPPPEQLSHGAQTRWGQGAVRDPPLAAAAGGDFWFRRGNIEDELFVGADFDRRPHLVEVGPSGALVK